MMSQFDFGLFFKALGLAFFMEGVYFAVAPRRMRETMIRAARMDDRFLRILGLTSMSVGLLIAYLLG